MNIPDNACLLCFDDSTHCKGVEFNILSLLKCMLTIASFILSSAIPESTKKTLFEIGQPTSSTLVELGFV